MDQQIRTVGILGAGVMGRGIAAHLANVAKEGGIESIRLLDILPPEAMIPAGRSIEEQGVRNVMAQRGLGAAKKSKPPLFTLRDYADRITVGNVEDHLEEVARTSDLLIEAVPEKEEIKRPLYETLFDLVGPDTLVGSNTSGFPTSVLTEGAPDAFRKNFLVTHFFNPVRYMKLLELVPGAETDDEVLERVEDWGTRTLGKGVVVGRDTPGFVGNRIGVEELNRLLNVFALEHGPEKLDYIFGRHLWGTGAKPFVTMEKIGLDTMEDVGDDIYTRTQDLDEGSPRVLPLPEFLRTMVKAGKLGEKSGSGFYKGRGREVLNLVTMEYEKAQGWGKRGPKIESVERAKAATKATGNPKEAHRIMWEADDEAGAIYRAVTMHNCVYALGLSDQICDGIESVDDAMRWGYNRALGPGEIVDAVRLERMVESATKAGLVVPGWAQDLAGKGESIYQRKNDGRVFVFDTDDEDHVEIEDGKITVEAIARENGTLYEIEDVLLATAEKGIIYAEIRSHKGTITPDVIKALNEVLDLSVEDEGYQGVVISHTGDPDFSLGADLKVLTGLAMRAKRDEPGAREALEAMSRDFQELNRRIRYHSKPVVVAKQGMAVGGGCELGFGAHTRATTETQMGLVEFAVGLLPGGGGLSELAFERYAMRSADGRLEDGVDALAHTRDAARSIAWNWFAISGSADEAKKLGFMKPDDRISRDPDHLLYDAGEDVYRLAEDYVPPREIDRSVTIPGAEGYTEIMNLRDWAIASNNVAHEYVDVVMEQLALALTTGPDGHPTTFTEQQMLDREREAFVNLALGDHVPILAARALKMKPDAFEKEALDLTADYIGGGA